MNKNNFCTHCLVDVEEDLRHCPLCGKFVASSVNDKPADKCSYPKIDQSYTLFEKWLKQVRSIMILLGLVAIAVNLFFKTDTYWFPYVLVGLFGLWRILFYPFKEGKSHISSIPMSGIIIAILLIFFDVYDYVFNGSTLGWALCYAVPAVFAGTTIVSFVLAITNKHFEESLTKGILGILLVNLIFLGSKLLWFNQFKNWPNFMSLLTIFVSIFLLFMFKKKRLVKELNRNFHI